MRDMKSSLARALPVLIVSIAMVSGCGADLSDGDAKVCAAADDDARAVYGAASLAEDEEIAKQAARVQMGTSDASDDDALAQIQSRCAELGWESPTDG